MSFTQTVTEELLNDTNLNKEIGTPKAFVREAFLRGGLISNPSKTYHMEFSLAEEQAQNLLEIFISYGLNPKKIARKGHSVVYIKEADAIADVLKMLGARKSLFSFEAIRVEKERVNAINRQVNFETANINKTVSAAVEQINAIKYIKKTVGLNQLPKTLKEIAELRLDNETLSLAEIGQLTHPPIGKSGVNHRLRKICKLADELKMKEEDFNG